MGKNITAINTIRNGIENGYPFVESMLSILPLVDEYLVNDGGSIDGTLEVLRRLEKTFPKIHLFQIEDYPSKRWDCVSDVLNKFIQLSKSDWIFLGNMDELIHENDVKKIREDILSEEVADVFRYDRKEVTHYWSKLTSETYYPARTARNIHGLYQNWNSYGGDEFLDNTGWIRDPPRVKLLPYIIYHLYAVFPKNMLNKRKNDAEWLAPGDRGRVAIYEKMRGKNFDSGRIPEPNDVYSGLPALARGLASMPSYFVRECLFNMKWLYENTGINYE